VPTELERLYREHRAGLVRLVERELRNHHDAEDVVQTAFLDAQRALERGTVPHNPRAWLAAIALNAGRRLRRRHLNAEPLEEYAVQEAARMPEIRAALAGLPKTQRAAVVYRDVLGLSYGETAEQLGTSVNAVTMLLHRARMHLRQALGVAAAGLGSWRWLRRAGMPQVTVVKGSAALVVAAGLATTGIVAAREVAPIGTPVQAAALAVPAGGPADAAGRTPRGTPMLDAAPRNFRRPDRSAATPASTQGPGGTASPSSVISSAAEPATSGATPTSRSTLPVPTVSLPAVSVTVPATVTVSTPVATVTVAIPAVTTATVTTPITTVTLPIP
jgi:RNA polymerase sigma-70 factor (ECF subfamily)